MYGLTGSKAALLIAASALVAPVGVWAGSHAQLSSSQVSSSSSASSSEHATSRLCVAFLPVFPRDPFVVSSGGPVDFIAAVDADST
jgi:hypothetical protein